MSDGKDVCCHACGKKVHLKGERDEKCPSCQEPAVARVEPRCSLYGRHDWNLKEETISVNRGTCQCGAIKYFPRNRRPETLQLVAHYNRKKGSAGQELGVRIERASKLIREATPSMADVARNADEFTETLNKPESRKRTFGWPVFVQMATKDLQPIPERPVAARARTKHYDKHRVSIIQYAMALGVRKTCFLWGINLYVTWPALFKRWVEKYGELPPSVQAKPERKAKLLRPRKPKPVTTGIDTAGIEAVLVEIRDALRYIATSGRVGSVGEEDGHGEIIKYGQEIGKTKERTLRWNRNDIT